jgi:hypothetical protein
MNIRLRASKKNFNKKGHRIIFSGMIYAGPLKGDGNRGVNQKIVELRATVSRKISRTTNKLDVGAKYKTKTITRETTKE